MLFTSDSVIAGCKRKKNSIHKTSLSLLPTRSTVTCLPHLSHALRIFYHTLNSHPFNQKVIVYLPHRKDGSLPFKHTDRTQDHQSSSSSSSSPSASPCFSPSSSSSSPTSSSSPPPLISHLVHLIQSQSIGVYLHEVSLSSFLHLPLQEFLFSRHEASLLSWAGPSSSSSSLSILSKTLNPTRNPKKENKLKEEEDDEEEEKILSSSSSSLSFSHSYGDVGVGLNAAAVTPVDGGTLLLRVRDRHTRQH
ncbi:transmembrane protein [Cystoisospora suis]|uniref:Transmembrane protein n=1 Tax=Cystoisospora suis TaxID=483139 RepID=A0A2C6L4L9_9APIC|nr:transmembrane protein [Cystoisospora suis]